MTSLLPRRLASIDIFRAITMLMMIFVNDLWSLQGIPGWLEHAGKSDDALGLADTVFPAFLFIVGLSIPFAISARQAKGASRNELLMYIGTRALALLLMGFFHVNLESYNNAHALLPKPVWQILITVSFFLIWLDYSPHLSAGKKRLFRGCGIALLAAMAILYSGGPTAHPHWMRPSWGGILGLIGWAYLFAAVIFVISKNNLGVLIGALIFFLLFNIAVNAEWLEFLMPVKKYIWISGDGSMPALSMAGVVACVLYRQADHPDKMRQSLLILLGMGIIMLIGGFALRPFWGISKIRATPSWVMICTAVSLGCFLILIYLVDIKNNERLFTIIRPGGTSTLTAYLLPYIHYALYNLIGASITLPLILRTGLQGIIKSLLYAFIIILVTGLLEKRRIRLRI